MSSENQMAIKECNRLKLSQCMGNSQFKRFTGNEADQMGIAIHNPDHCYQCVDES